MKRTAFAAASLAAIAFVIAFVWPALAQTTDTQVHVGGLYDLFLAYILPIVGTVVSALIGWVMYEIKRRTGFDIEKATRDIEWLHRDALGKAAENAAGKFLAGFDSLRGVSVDVKNPLIAQLANEAIRRVPDAAGFFHLSPDDFSQLVVARIGVLTAATPDEPAPVPAAA